MEKTFKRLLSLLVVAFMIFGMIVPATPVHVHAATEQEVASIAAEIAKGEMAKTMQFPDDLVNGKATCPVCNQNVTWTAITSNEQSLATSGHYYVATNLEGTDVQITKTSSGTSCLHLNNKTVKNTGTARNTLQHGDGILNIMGDGVISGQRSGVGGAQSYAGTVNIYGGTFTKAAGSGAPVYKVNATMNMFGGCFDDSATTTAGYTAGNILMESDNSVFNMYAGTVKGGKSTTTAGNIRVSKGQANIYGGTITGGVVTNGVGNDIYLSKNAKGLHLDYAPVIGDLYVASGAKLTIGDLVDGADIGLQMEDMCKIADGKGAYAGKYIHSTEAGGSVINATNGNLTYSTALCGDNYCPACDKEVTWAASGNVWLTSGQHAYLAADKKPSYGFNQLGKDSDGTSCLHLNGQAINRTSTTASPFAYSGKEGSVLNMLGRGTISGSRSSGGITTMNWYGSSNSTLNLYGVTLTKNGDAPVNTLAVTNKHVLNINDGASIDLSNVNIGRALSLSSGAVVNLNGGTIKAAKKGTSGESAALFQVPAGVTVVMNSGYLLGNASDNTNNVGAGAVQVNGGSFTMNGGTITGGKAKYGGNIYLTSGSFTMNGGTITGGTATSNGGGNIMQSGGVMEIAGGEIVGGNAGTSQGGNIKIDGGTSTTISGGTISGGSAGLGKNIYVTSSKTLNVTGGTINGDVYANSGAINVSGKDTVMLGTIGKGSSATIALTGGTFSNAYKSYTSYACLKDNGDGTFTIIAAEHGNVQTVPGKDPTCGEPGLLEGKTCLDCGTVIQEQGQTAPTGEHTWSATKFAENLDMTNGTYELVTRCTVCNAEQEGSREQVTKLPGVTDGVQPDANGMAYCPVCQDMVKWQPFYTETALTIPAGGHYYLAAPINYTGTDILLTMNQNIEVCFNLNGKDITATAAGVMDLANGTLNLMGQGTISGCGNAWGKGTINAKGGKLNFYSGTLTKQENVTAGHILPLNNSSVVNLYENAVIDGRNIKSNQASIFFVGKATLNIKGATLQNGYNTGSGGMIRVNGSNAVVNMESGLLINNYAGSSGQTIYMDAEGQVNISGGVIDKGSYQGGVIKTKGTINITGGTFPFNPASFEDYTTYECIRYDAEAVTWTVEAKEHAYGEYISNNDASCGQAGTKTATCSVCQRQDTIEDEGTALEHDWTVSYEWSEDGKSCTAIRTCANSEACKQTAVADISSTVKDPATCEGEGTTTYTASFEAEWAEEQTMDVEDIDALGHGKSGATYHTAKDATCTEAGNIGYTTCEACGKNFRGDNDYTVELADGAWIIAINPEAHKWNAGEQTKAPTCVEEGKMTFTCQHNGEHTYTESIASDPNAHDIEEHEGQDATCGADGWKAYVTCKRDGCNYTTYEKIEATGDHNYTVEKERVNATCTEDGYVIWACGCGAVNPEKEILKAPGHGKSGATYHTAKDATCTETGNIGYTTCEACGKNFRGDNVYTEELADGAWIIAINPEAHKWNAGEQTKAPTCVAEGEMTFTCQHNGEHTYTKPIASDPNAHDIEEHEGQDATCGADGWKAYVTCKRDGCNYTTYEKIEATGDHNYTVEKERVNATCTEDGYVIWACGCGAVNPEKEILKAPGHAMGDWVVEKNPTCTMNGSQRKDCANCDHYIRQDIPKNGHTAAEAVEENRVAADCVNDGSYEMVVYCSVCDAELDRDTFVIDALGHKYEAVVTPPALNQQGYTTHTCSVCGDSYVDSYVDALKGVATINGYGYATLEAAIDAALKSGEAVELIADVEVDVIAGKNYCIEITDSVTIDGNGHSVTYVGAVKDNRVFNVNTTGTVKFNELKIDAAARAINIIDQSATVILNKVTAEADNNAVMIATTAGAANVTITNSDLTGLAVVNVAGAGAQVKIENTTITNVDANAEENYGAITVWSTAENAKVTVTGGEINVADDSKKAYNYTESATIEGVDEIGKVVAMVGNAGYDTLQEAINDAAKSGETVELIADVEVDEVILINGDVTINGNDHTVTSSASRIFRITAAGADVEVNELNMIATKTGSDVRGISIDVEADGAKLTVNDSTITGACYAINNGGADDCTITVNDGTFEGLNVINVHGTNNTINVDGAKLNSDYPMSESFYGFGVWADGEGNVVNVKNTTFTGDNARPYGDETLNVTEENNINKMQNPVAMIGSNYYYSLEEAAEAAANGQTIKLICNVDVAFVQLKEGVVLDLNGNTVKGTVLGTLKMNGGDLITAEGHKMIGANAEHYYTTDAVVTIGATEIEIVSGYVKVIGTWYTTQGHILTIGQAAIFEIPADGKMVVNGSQVFVEGTVANYGLVEIINGGLVKGDVIGTFKVKGGTFATNDYVMAGPASENPVYIANNATFSIDVPPTLNTTVLAGEMILNANNTYTLSGQILTIAEGAKFTIPAGLNMYVNNSTVIVNGDAEIAGTVTLITKSAVVKLADDGALIDQFKTTAGAKVLYVNGEYIVHDHTAAEAVEENRVEATCTADGKYDTVVYCSVCGDEMDRDTTVITAKGHTETTLDAVAPDCENTGLTAGKKCSVCGVHTQPQAVVPALGHTYESEIDYAAGKKIFTCHCGDSYEEILPALPQADVADKGATTYVGSYFVFNPLTGSHYSTTGGIALPKTLVFTAKENAEQAAQNYYKDFNTDFYVKLEGLSAETVKGTGCYLAGNYAGMWVMIPLDDVDIVNGLAYPLLAIANFDFSYEMICDQVKEFTCGLYLSDEFVAANPGVQVSVDLGIREEQVKDLDDLPNLKFLEVEAFDYDKEDLVAEVVATVNGINFYSLAAAVEAAEEGDEIILVADTKVGQEGVTFTETVTLNLNGNDITSDGEVIIVTAGTLTIKGEGLVSGSEDNTGSGSAVWAKNGGNVVILGGTYQTGKDVTFSDQSHSNDTIYAASGSTITIEGGKFIATEGTWLLNLKDNTNAKIIVNGGEFYGFNPMNNASEGANTNFVVAEKHAKLVGDKYIIELHSEQLAVEENRVEATCTADGKYDTVVYCECGEELDRDTFVITAKGHTAAEAVKENEVAPSVDAVGGYDMVVYCSVCGAELSRVHTEIASTAVANFNGIKNFDDVSDALKYAAQNGGGTVTLVANATEDDMIIVKKGIKLDLNGWTLTAGDSVMAEYDTAEIIDSTNGNGKLLVADDELFLYSTNEMLPIRTAAGEYIFLTAKINSKLALTKTEDSAQIQFAFHQAPTAAKLAELLANNNASELGVQLRIRFLGEQNGMVRDFYFYYDDAMLQEYGTYWTGVLKTTITGVSAFESYEMRAELVFGAGTEAEVVIAGSTCR